MPSIELPRVYIFPQGRRRFLGGAFHCESRNASWCKSGVFPPIPKFLRFLRVLEVATLREKRAYLAYLATVQPLARAPYHLPNVPNLSSSLPSPQKTVIRSPRKTSTRQNHTEKALQHYVLDGFVSTHVALHQGMSRAYLYLSTFEEDAKRRQAMYSRRCAPGWGGVQVVSQAGESPCAMRAGEMVVMNRLFFVEGLFRAFTVDCDLGLIQYGRTRGQALGPFHFLESVPEVCVFLWCYVCFVLFRCLILLEPWLIEY